MAVTIPSPFLTELDSRALVKGSRDPLGVQAIWTRLGRHVVGNVTTVSTSVRDFTVTMLGYYFAERAAEEGNADGDLGVFLRWEQLAAYARGGGNGDWEFRGTDRTRKAWGPEPGPNRIRLGTDSGSLILSDQKTYGLWGLYSVASRSSGLVEGDPTRLTPAARDFVEANYLPLLGSRALSRTDGLVAVLSKKSVEMRPKDRDQALFDAVAKILQKNLTGLERSFYVNHLVNGGPVDSTNGGQRLLASGMHSTFKQRDWELTPAGVGHFAKQCRGEGELGRQVASNLEKIRIAEQLLAPATSLFSFLLTRDNQPADEVVRSVRERWGAKVSTIDPAALESIEPELVDASNDRASSARWLAVANALATGDYAEAIRQLLDQNRAVMTVRGGAAPWAEIREGKLSVKFVAEDESHLPPRDELPSLWRHSYFLDSLRTVAMQLEA
jgi:hypothetical protein